MRPKPFTPEKYDGAEPYVRDRSTGLVWHRIAHRTLYVDTDRSGVVYHSNYLRYFEIGRVGLMRDGGFSYRAVEESGYVYPVVETGLTYHDALFYDDPIWINTRPSELERVRIRFDYIVTHSESGKVVCKGFTTHCALNGARMPVAVDPQTVKMWESFPR